MILEFLLSNPEHWRERAKDIRVTAVAINDQGFLGRDPGTLQNAAIAFNPGRHDASTRCVLDRRHTLSAVISRHFV
jgi:hypothetical protein